MLANRPIQALADLFEKSVSQLISQVVVELLEAIQVDATNSKQFALPLRDDHRLP